MINEFNGFNVIKSNIDSSINFSKSTDDGGMVETRFVRRVKERFIIYISSMSGCNKACRFCHLTQTRQTMSLNMTESQMLEQAETVLSSLLDADFRDTHTVHFNFMARGEPMSNPMVNKNLFYGLKSLAQARGLFPRIKISSIIPNDFTGFDIDHLWGEDCPPIDFYYSLYNTDPSWRKRWIPKALPPVEAFKWLSSWQKTTGNRVILHWALIAGENDSLDNARDAARMANEAGLSWDFNLVSYNPANEKSSESSQEQINMFLDVLRAEVGDNNRVKIIPRVGFDVKASCGMFLTQDVA